MVPPKMERFLEQKHFKHDNTPMEVKRQGNCPPLVVDLVFSYSILKMNKMSISKIFDEL